MSDTTPNGPDNVVLEILRAIRADQATHSRRLDELRIEVRDGFHDLRGRLSALEQGQVYVIRNLRQTDEGLARERFELHGRIDRLTTRIESLEQAKDRD